jgi:hypothetical protein
MNTLGPDGHFAVVYEAVAHGVVIDQMEIQLPNRPMYLARDPKFVSAVAKKM